MTWIQDLGMDVRFAWRMLRRQPVHACASVLTLALGIGATTAVFAVVDATLLRPLAYPEPDRLVGLNSLKLGPDGTQIQYVISQMELLRWRAATRSFAYIESIEPRTMALTGQGEPEVVPGGLASSGFFKMLGVEPKIGRTYTADEERQDAAVAVLSETLWRRRFNEDPSVLGRTIALDGRSFEVIGVMPARFRSLFEGSEVWIPLRPGVDPARVAARLTLGAGRLQKGVTLAQAQAELAPISAELAREFPPTHGGTTPEVLLLQERVYGPRRPALLAIAAGVLVLFGLACVNIVNLTLGHVATRRSEFLVRAAMGGSRWRLVRQQLVQSTIVSIAGSALGIWLMTFVLPGMLALNASGGLTPIVASIDWRVAAFGASLAVATAILSGTIPALRAHGASFEGDIVRASGRARGGRGEQRMRGLLVVAQIALAVALLCAAGTFLASLQRLLGVAPGFSPDSVLSMQLTIAPARYPDIAARATYVQRILERVAAIPGVTAAGTTQTTFLPNQSMQTLLAVDGRPIDPERGDSAHMRHITPGYFKALLVPIVEGRAFDDRDRLGAPPVCMVSARFAKQFWPNESALGHRVRRSGATAQWMTVVGVVGDVMDAGLGVPQGPTLYVDYLQANTPTARVSLVVRAAGDPLAVARAVQQDIWSIDPLQAIDRVARLRDVLITTTSDQRFQTMLLGSFALVGLALALVGIYGVTSASVTARAWETGVRLALGATHYRVMSTILREAGLQVALGAIAGTALFVGAGRFASRLLYDTSYADVRVLAAATALLGGIAMAVVYGQARRLSRISPVLAMRDDGAGMPDR